MNDRESKKGNFFVKDVGISLMSMVFGWWLVHGTILHILRIITIHSRGNPVLKQAVFEGTAGALEHCSFVKMFEHQSDFTRVYIYIYTLEVDDHYLNGCSWATISNELRTISWFYEMVLQWNPIWTWCILVSPLLPRPTRLKAMDPEGAILTRGICPTPNTIRRYITQMILLP